jgi:hypothetical protein
MALGSTQTLTEMSNRNLPWGQALPMRKADNLAAIWEPLKYESYDVLQPYGTPRPI